MFSDNVIRSGSNPLVTEITKPIRMKWERNVMSGEAKTETPRALAPAEVGPDWLLI